MFQCNMSWFVTANQLALVCTDALAKIFTLDTLPDTTMYLYPDYEI